MEFHNPYNFLPAVPRGDGGERMPEGLRDGKPAGHHRWHTDRLSGRISVRMEVVTPMVLPRVRKTDDNDHRELEVATAKDAEGVDRVDLAPTQIKGMLRSAFEAVTNSRFGVFDHDRPVGYRTEVEGAISLRPALVHSRGDVELLGQLVLNERGDTTSISPAVVVPVWNKAGEGRVWKLGNLAHGDEVEADVVVEKFFDGKRAVAVAVGRPGGLRHKLDEKSGRQYVVRGYLHVTGPNIMRKRAERLFVTKVVDGRRQLRQNSSKRLGASQSKELVDQLEALVRHQRDVHTFAERNEVTERRSDRKHGPWEYLGHEPGRTAWSRHLYDVDERDDPPGWVGPNWAIPDGTGGRPLTCWAESNVTGLRPVMVSRLMHANTPAELLDRSLHPAEDMHELSPADRVFGWVRQGRGERASAAHRGQLRVTELNCPTAKKAVVGAPVTLPPLAVPKPLQGRFYLGVADREGLARPLEPELSRGETFRQGQTLRGRKTYPHQRWIEGLGHDQKLGRLRYKAPKGRQDKDNQNVTLAQWVKPGSVFTFTLDVRDLHPMELGALLWLLDPRRLGRGDHPGRLRIGWGKPLGLGSVKLSLVGPPAIRTGAEVAERLNTLGASQQETDVSDLAERFEEAMARAGLGVVLDVMRTAAVGYADDVPVRYPSADPSLLDEKNKKKKKREDSGPSEPGYTWFVLNEKAAKSGKGQSLPLLGDAPLRGYSRNPADDGKG